MQCEMCGSDGQLFRVDIEGSVLIVCKSCASFGKILGSASPKPAPKRAAQKPVLRREELTEYIRSDYGRVIKEARERKGLKQKDMAERISEKESLIHKMESGHFEPNHELARKLERFLNISLIEQFSSDEDLKVSHVQGSELTIGDKVRIRKRG